MRALLSAIALYARSDTAQSSARLCAILFAFCGFLLVLAQIAVAFVHPAEAEPIIRSLGMYGISMVIGGGTVALLTRSSPNDPKAALPPEKP